MLFGKNGSKPRRLHIGLVVERCDSLQPQQVDIGADLRAEGHQVTLIDLEKALQEMENGNWLDSLDLIIIRGQS